MARISNRIVRPGGWNWADAAAPIKDLEFGGGGGGIPGGPPIKTIPGNGTAVVFQPLPVACCCVEEFEYPLKLGLDVWKDWGTQGRIFEFGFTGKAKFKEEPGCRCAKCEFRQYRKFTADFYNVPPGALAVYRGLPNDATMVEDKLPPTPPAFKDGDLAFGHRDQNASDFGFGWNDGYADTYREVDDLMKLEREYGGAGRTRWNNARRTKPRTEDALKKAEKKVSSAPEATKAEWRKAVTRYEREIVRLDRIIKDPRVGMPPSDDLKALRAKRPTGCFFKMEDRPGVGLRWGMEAVLKYEFSAFIFDATCSPRQKKPHKFTVKFLVKMPRNRTGTQTVEYVAHEQKFVTPEGQEEGHWARPTLIQVGGNIQLNREIKDPAGRRVTTGRR